eukprot:13648272-Ditylum_brightwellii.AAC.1
MISHDTNPIISQIAGSFDKGIAKYQGYIGVFCWMIELGRIDILTEASHLASYQALPCEGHLDA